MGSGRRQRGRYRNNYINKKMIRILVISVIVLAIALVASFAFYFGSLQSLLHKVQSIDVGRSNGGESNGSETVADENVSGEDESAEVFGPEYNGVKDAKVQESFIGPRNGNTSFTITALGDILCHNTQYMDAYKKDSDSYDFSYVFENIKYYTQTGDLTIANLETSFAGKERGYSNYPRFNSPDELAFSMKDIGVDVITTAGNHCLDMGFDGLSRTIDTLNNADIAHLGTYKSQEERDAVFTKFVKGVKIAFIDYTYGTNGIAVPSDKQFCVNLINRDLIASDIEKAKGENPDMIIACMHWGTEYQTSANDEQKQLSDFLFENGVDVILGNHPHCLEPMEKREVTLADGSKKDCFVIYALGNFMSDQKEDMTKNSVILNLNFTKHPNGSISIDSADYVPIHMFKDSAAKEHKFKILDLERSLSAYESTVDLSLGQSNYEYLKKQLDSIKSIVGEEF